MDGAKWYLRTQDETFGPEPEAKLIEWAKLGRVQPGQEISDDNVIWTKVEDVAFLDMRYSIDIGDGNPRGPFHRAAAEALLASGRLPPTATMVETRAPFEDEKEAVREGMDRLLPVLERRARFHHRGRRRKASAREQGLGRRAIERSARIPIADVDREAHVEESNVLDPRPDHVVVRNLLSGLNPAKLRPLDKLRLSLGTKRLVLRSQIPLRVAHTHLPALKGINRSFREWSRRPWRP